ncbi:hypothetical protein [Geodermatophilus sp. URMC 62]|uniref:hypothetical protein n=1 Tax=Geodermatophilus sp. URMC 62 TaxID=3423414 RepID=UPI00406D21F3
MRSVLVTLVLALAVGGLAAAVVHPTAPQEPWRRRLVRLVPLSLVMGAVLARCSAGA